MSAIATIRSVPPHRGGRDSRRARSLGDIWKGEWRDRKFIAEFILTIILLMVAIRLGGFILAQMDLRKGAALADPFLTRFKPIDVRWVTFSVLWPSLLLGIFFLLREPQRLVMGLQAAAMILIFRTFTVYIIPLEPLPTIIPLMDPIVEYLGTGKTIVRDLLFSGHASTMFLLCVSAHRIWLRVVFLLGTVIVGMCVVLQHVHYSGDVFIAPFFAYTSWRIVCVLHDKIGPRPVEATPV